MVTYQNYDVSVRKDLVEAQERCWSRLSETGTWLDSKRKLDIAAEVRNARSCTYCGEQKNALSPDTIKGSHQTLGLLDDNQVELIHRVVSDPGRLSKKWFKKIISRDLKEEEYVEIIGIIAMVMVVDTFTCALGLEDHALPEPKSGQPNFYESPGAKIEAAWIPIIEPDDVTENDGELYPNPKVGYILRALSAVPNMKRHFWDLMFAHYLPEPAIYEFDRDYRAITRSQMEVIAARVSALHQCIY